MLKSLVGSLVFAEPFRLPRLMTGKPVPVFKAFQICCNLYILFVNISRFYLPLQFELSWLLDPCCTKVDGSVHVNHRTSCGLLVDVAALRKFGPQVTAVGDR